MPQFILSTEGLHQGEEGLLLLPPPSLYLAVAHCVHRPGVAWAVAMPQGRRMPSPVVFKLYFETLSVSKGCFSDCSSRGMEKVGGHEILRGGSVCPLTRAAPILCVLQIGLFSKSLAGSAP